jgi:hypothetical protein
VVDLVCLDGAALRNNVLEDLPEAWNVPLSVSQFEQQPAFRLSWRYCESPVERAAGGNYLQVRVEHQKGLPYGIDDGFSQVMSMRYRSERIAFGHEEFRLICSVACWTLPNLTGNRTAPSHGKKAPGNTRGRFITRRHNYAAASNA